ncbi:hypothetical protein Prum_078030 [Phytohabitans rumicis]|uniref:Clostripain n=2 Tax=Phytohabitans rumicis TaxID=1076125 RepID=A0A6V8LH25_9ACTN|nr:hypothetical protein Prum_078030 [Phytohabitans rumicis]
MVYMAANNSLSGAAGVDLEELRAVGSSERVRVLTFVKQRTGTAQYIEVSNGDDEVREDLGTIDSGDPNTVTDFVRWCLEHAPARRYALVLWNHGGGWVPDDIEQLYQEIRDEEQDTGVTRGEINFLTKGRVGRAVFTPSIKRILALPTARDRAICNDDTSGHSLDTIEVERILRTATGLIGRPLDLFGMDACLMSTLEVAYQLRDLTRHVVGSEELEPGDGWRYDAILRALADNPEMDGRALAETVVRTYVDSYRDMQGQWPVTQCAVDTAQIGAFTDALGAFQRAVTAELATAWPMLQRAHARATRFQFDLVDLKTLCEHLAAMEVGDELQDACQAVIAAHKPGGYVVAEGHLGPTVEGCGGISLYLPSPLDELNRYYDDLAFAKELGWDDLLRDYQRAVREG